MKKLIPILFFIILITSCEKKSCYECTIIKTYWYYHNLSKTKTELTSNTFCGITASEAREWEQDHRKSDSVTIGSPGDHYIYEEFCVCINSDW